MRRNKRRIAKLAAIVLAVGAGTAPAATADAKVWSERAGDRSGATVEVKGDMDTQTTCALWEQAMGRVLALYGITGSQAVSYLAQRADNPCHAPITGRSLFHAGDPGRA
jgi:hypothetical protein